MDSLKWVEAVPMTNERAETVASALVESNTLSADWEYRSKFISTKDDI
jgi:hypothetical protein